MLEFLGPLIPKDENSLILVALMCTWAVFIVRNALPHPLMAGLVYPGFVITALATDLLLREHGLQPTSDKIVNLAFATGTGVTLAFGLFAGLFWLAAQRSR